jgi:deazaflavin-dependent oxidoreductase (nitroreductase family)
VLNLLLKIMAGLHNALFRLSGGRIGGRFPGGAPVLLLTVKGRKTGKPRTAPLLYLADGERIVIVASKGGAPEDPLWYKNLVANPEVDVEVRGAPRKTMRAATGTDEQRNAYWPKLVSMYSGYAAYQKRTERRIPIVVLTPLNDAGD